MTKLALLFSILLSASAFGAATSPNAAYIHDVEGLLNSVDSRDPSRPQLTLKLADALFNEALTISGQPDLKDAEKRKITSDRKRAVQLYQESLTGLKGLYPAPSGAARAKIQFQMARLYTDLGENAQAETIWKDLASQDAVPEMQRESLLRLAEILENRAGKEDLKKAEAYYKKALTLCSNQDVCSYSHYRLAWVYEREERHKEAIAEMNEALWDSKGQVREESLRDLIGFMGGAGDDGKDSLEKMEKLSAKIKRPSLISDLSGSYFSHGNRKAGVYILDAVNRKNPTLKSYVRLMEEDYGFRDWQKFDTELDAATDIAAKGNANPDPETEKILRRLTVQLDGERATQPKSADAFKRSVMLYLALFPNKVDLREHMIDGWIASEQDDNAKIKQLQIWIAEEQKAGRTKTEERYRRMRASAAQKVKNYPVVAEEMAAIGALAKTPAQKRESLYQVADAKYQNKEYDAAYPLFIELANVPAGAAPDKWAILSQNLALDILGQKKDYAGVVKQAQTWTTNPHYASWIQNAKEHKDELSDIKKVETSARFEWATSLGNTKEALDVFQDYCEKDMLLPKSCSNAQVLAVKLGDQPALIAILKKLNKKDELANELEASAEFAQAAQMLEKKLKETKGGGTNKDYLKVALLYELGNSKVNRDRMLHELVAHMNGKKFASTDEEDLILTTLKDADLLNVALLKLPWKKENREYLTDYLVSHGKGTPELQAQLVKSCHDTGPAWEKTALTELRKLDDKQKAIHFAGKGSKRKFESRVAAMKGLTERGNCYLESTTAEQRVIFATLLARAENQLADEIKSAPIPDGVDEEGKASLEKALAEMAQPFADKGAELEKLANAQLEKVEDVAKREDLKTKMAAKDDSLFTPSAATTSPRQPIKEASAAQSPDVAKAAIEELHRNPNQKQSLIQLKSYYESNGNPRLAAYFQGRLQSLGEEGKQ